MNIKSAGRTDVGRKRSNNQDSILLSPDMGLFVIADGMGGHSGGEVASSIAAKSLEKFVDAEENKTLSPDLKMESAIKFASHAIFEFAKVNPKLRGMGTTVTACLITPEFIHIGQVGDSRCYVLSQQQLFQITEDHSQVYELLKAGAITEEEIGQIQRNVITRSVGFEAEVQVDLYTRRLLRGDKYLLCSDGLSGMVSNEQIARVMSHFSPDDAVSRLVDLANVQGGEDNISTIILEVI